LPSSACAAARCATTTPGAAFAVTARTTVARTRIATRTLVFGFFFDHRRVVAAERVALVDPHLDTDDAVGGLRFREA
jgi:hypothetical protein